ncbi:MAG: hypothetical protein AAFX39_01285 [Pseudomonadota bacterium]
MTDIVAELRSLRERAYRKLLSNEDFRVLIALDRALAELDGDDRSEIAESEARAALLRGAPADAVASTLLDTLTVPIEPADGAETNGLDESLPLIADADVMPESVLDEVIPEDMSAELLTELPQPNGHDAASEAAFLPDDQLTEFLPEVEHVETDLDEAMALDQAFDQAADGFVAEDTAQESNDDSIVDEALQEAQHNGAPIMPLTSEAEREDPAVDLASDIAAGTAQMPGPLENQLAGLAERLSAVGASADPGFDHTRIDDAMDSAGDMPASATSDAVRNGEMSDVVASSVHSGDMGEIGDAAETNHTDDLPAGFEGSALEQAVRQAMADAGVPDDVADPFAPQTDMPASEAGHADDTSNELRALDAWTPETATVPDAPDAEVDIAVEMGGAPPSEAQSSIADVFANGVPSSQPAADAMEPVEAAGGGEDIERIQPRDEAYEAALNRLNSLIDRASKQLRSNGSGAS